MRQAGRGIGRMVAAAQLAAGAAARPRSGSRRQPTGPGKLVATDHVFGAACSQAGACSASGSLTTTTSATRSATSATFDGVAGEASPSMRTTSNGSPPVARRGRTSPGSFRRQSPGARAAVATVRMRMADPLTRSGAGKTGMNDSRKRHVGDRTAPEDRDREMSPLRHRRRLEHLAPTAPVASLSSLRGTTKRRERFKLRPPAQRRCRDTRTHRPWP